jgi:hypothetical protein
MIYPDLNKLLSEATASLKDTDNPERAATIALELAELHDMILETLEPLKEALRGYASELKSPGEPEVRINSAIRGHVVVTFPPRSVSLSKSANIDRLKRALGEHFADYFEEKVTYKPVKHFTDLTLEGLKGTPNPATSAEIRIALAEVEIIEPTTRVGFKYRL